MSVEAEEVKRFWPNSESKGALRRLLQPGQD